MRRERVASSRKVQRLHVAFDASRDDLLLAVMAFGVREQRRNQQRLLHHQSVHDSFR